MLFSSITFLYVFLPMVTLCYFLVPKRVKNYVLLVFSLLFYGWGEPRVLWVMLLEILCAYVFGLLLEKYKHTAPAKVLLGASFFINLGFLLYFKYVDFFLETFGQVTGVSVKLLGIALPIGISFYTFQIISYTVDVYRGEVAAQRNPFLLATYVSMFPQLIAGPIVRYADVEKQLRERVHSFELAAAGIRRFVLGLGKKVLLANALGALCNQFRVSTDLSVAYYWLYAIAFTLHIYFDFSGYSDMAIGLGKVFGFTLKENFEYPYVSGSITEFWRRWHMSLGSWFRDYVYIPLGGNRVSKKRWFFNIFIVWFLTGFWHGASWNFIVWGIFFAVFLALEKLFLGKYLERAKIGKHVYVLLLVIISFVIFNGVDMTQALSDLAGMVGVGTNSSVYRLPLVSREALYYLRSYGMVLVLAVIGATPLPKKFFVKIKESAVGAKVCNVMEPVWLLGLLVIITAYLVDGSFNPFLYFRF